MKSKEEFQIFYEHVLIKTLQPLESSRLENLIKLKRRFLRSLVKNFRRIFPYPLLKIDYIVLWLILMIYLKYRF